MRQLIHLRTYEVALAKAGLGPVAGVDEAGRGACAGPITIAACILPDKPIAPLAKLGDSKKLTPALREHLYPLIKRHALAWSVISISAEEIDRRGIQTINIEGMRRAIARLAVRPGYVLSDAWYIPGLTCPHVPMIGGDAAARCIAAASVLAKVTRDNLMSELHQQFPNYGLDRHKGYSTKSHLDAVRRHGASPIHRYTYANVAKAHEEYRDAVHQEGANSEC